MAVEAELSPRRDYSLVGRDTQLAVERGLAAAQWYHTEVPRQTMKELMQRSDAAAIRDTLIWLGAMVVFAGIGIWLWGSWWCVPFFLAYGVLYGSASDSRWHECGHGTAFKTPRLNRLVYQIACFMIMRNPTIWRWSHARHHTDTIIVGRDPEIAVMRPPDLVRLVLNFVGLVDVWYGTGAMLRYAAGRLAPALDDPRRGAYFRWSLFAPSVIEPGAMAKMQKWEFRAGQAGWGDFDAMTKTIDHAIGSGPWLLGDMFSIADVVFGGTLRYMVRFGMLQASLRMPLEPGGDAATTILGDP